MSEGRKSVPDFVKVGRGQAVGMQARQCQHGHRCAPARIKGKEEKIHLFVADARDHSTPLRWSTPLGAPERRDLRRTGFLQSVSQRTERKPHQNESCVRLLLNVE